MAAIEERDHKINYYKKKDCRKMMQDFNLECLKLNYLLKRDSHQVIGRRTEKIEVIPKTYMNFKVITKD